MTDTRKPYDPAWPHGFETRIGRAVRLIGATRTGNLVWEYGTEIFQTDAGGSRGVPNAFRDIFCTPAPAKKPLECWVNVQDDGILTVHQQARSAHICGAAAKRVAVHMREVMPEPDGGALEFGLRADLGQSEGGTLGAEPDYRVDRGCGLPSEPAAKELGGLSAEQVKDLASGWEESAKDTSRYNIGARSMLKLLAQKLRYTAGPQS